jgi:DNA repair protein RadC
MPEEETRTVYRTMREIADDERPRERLIEHGPGVLSESELVAVILGSGNRGENVIDFARRILESSGGLAGLVRADVQSLRTTKGLGPAKAAQIAAAIELGRRVQSIDPDARPRLMTPEATFAFMRGRLTGKAKETLYVLSLDAKGRLLSVAVAAEGSLNTVQWRGGDVFRDPIICQAHSIVLVHNHPSGDPTPSPQDIRSTQEVKAAGAILGIELHDHVIIGQNRFVSLAAIRRV